MAAEITTMNDIVSQALLRFNEAAANGRGNRKSIVKTFRFGDASMRPRRMAAEILIEFAKALNARDVLQ